MMGLSANTIYCLSVSYRLPDGGVWSDPAILATFTTFIDGKLCCVLPSTIWSCAKFLGNIFLFVIRNQKSEMCLFNLFISYIEYSLIYIYKHMG